MDNLKQQVQELTPEQWVEFLGWVTGTERARRDALPAVEEAQAEIMAEVWEAQPDLKPAYVGTVDPGTPTLDALLAQLPAWVQPTSKATAYPPASLVKHVGKAWRNRRRGLNSAEPGTAFSGWEDVTAELLKPVPVQDGNADDAATTDAPGLITEPEPEPKPEPKPEQPKQTEPTVTPAPGVKQWKTDEWYSKGETVLDGGALYVSQKLHKATDRNRPTAGTGDWQRLD